ncbi:type II toxin-antitoxin system HicB family antitoxin [Halomonas sp. WWR20]
MNELIYEVGVQQVQGALQGWEVHAPDLPEFRVLGMGYSDALNKAREAIVLHLASLLARNKELPTPAPMMMHMHNDAPFSRTSWHYLKIQMGPLPEGKRRVVDVLPDAEGYIVVEKRE